MKKDSNKEKEKLVTIHTSNSTQFISIKVNQKPLKKNKLDKLNYYELFKTGECLNDRLFLKDFDYFKLHEKVLSNINIELITNKQLAITNHVDQDLLATVSNKADHYVNLLNEMPDDLYSKYPQNFPIKSKFVKKDIEEDLNCPDDIQYTIKEIATRYGYKYSTIYKYIKHDLGYTYKKASSLNIRSFNKDTPSKLLIFYDKLKRIKDSNSIIIYIDESKFVSDKKSKSRWVKNDTSNIVYSPDSSTSFNLVVAISMTDVIYYEIHDSNLNSNLFSKFLTNLKDKIIEKYYYSHENILTEIYLVIDNCKVHCSKITVRCFQDCKFNILYIPEYCPFVNTVEYVFRVLKKKFYRHFIYNK